MKALVLVEPFKLVVEDREAPKPKSGEVVVKVDTCTIAGTDLRIYAGVVKVKLPLILGQEFAGLVEEIGEGVEGFNRGDKVAVEPVLSCGFCRYCRRGLYTLCEQLKVMGVSADGGMSQYVKVPAAVLHKVPESLSLEEAALTTPTAVALYAVEKADVHVGEDVVVFGAGAIGLSAVQLLKLRGAGEVVVVEIDEAKRSTALKLGADKAIAPEEVDQAVKKPPAKVLETTGSVPALRKALEIVGKAGRLVVVGAYGREANLPPDLIVRKDLDVRGSWLYPHAFNISLSLIAKGKVKVKDYVKARYPLEQAEQAFKEAAQPDVVRVALKP